jgi:hypothetical protein
MRTTSLCIRASVLVASTAVLIGCAALSPGSGLDADQVVIADAFDRKNVNASNIGAEVQNCFPYARVAFNTLQWQNQPFGSISTTTIKGARNFFVATKTQAVCVLETTGGFPVLPVEAIEFRTFFTEIPRAEQQQWFRQVAKSLAKSGNAELVVSTGNGATNILTYEVVIGSKGMLKVTQRFVAAGQNKGAINPLAISVVNAASLAMRITQRPSAINLPIPDTTQGTEMPVFFESLPNPPLPVRIERSVLSDLPKSFKP